MGAKIRRIVTGVNASGQAVVIEDRDAPNTNTRPEMSLQGAMLWVTDETPADLARYDDPTDRQIGVAPPPGGSIIRVVDFLPAGDVKVDNKAFLRQMGLSHDANGRHPFMHRTKSIDYAIILDGEIDMLLDEGEVHVKAGDVLIQRGTNHAWVNRSSKACRIVFVLIDAKDYPPSNGAEFPQKR